MTEPDRRCWRYRLFEGVIDAKIFDSPDVVPDGEGWRDTPAAFLDADQAEHLEERANDAEPAKKRGRPAKVK